MTESRLYWTEEVHPAELSVWAREAWHRDAWDREQAELGNLIGLRFTERLPHAAYPQVGV